jgi:hypothetical protein
VIYVTAHGEEVFDYRWGNPPIIMREVTRMDRLSTLREVEQQIKKDFVREITEKESLYTCMLLEWLMRNEIITPDHVEMFVSECVARTVANADGLINEELLEKGRA